MIQTGGKTPTKKKKKKKKKEEEEEIKVNIVGQTYRYLKWR